MKENCGIRNVDPIDTSGLWLNLLLTSFLQKIYIKKERKIQLSKLFSEKKTKQMKNL